MEFSVEIPFAWLLDDQKLDEIAKQGVTAICAPYTFIESLPKETLRERAVAFAQRGLRVDTAHPNFGSYNQPYSLVNQYKTERGLYLEQLKDGMERMALLGARVAPLHTGGCCVPGAPQWSFDLCAESVRSLVRTAEDTGVTLALENTFYSVPQRWHGGTNAEPLEYTTHQYDDVATLCRLIDACESSMVQGCFDAGHAHLYGDLTGDHEQMMPRIALYHLHDNGGDKDSHVAPGYGGLRWDKLGPLVAANEKASPYYIEADPWMRGTHGLMIRQTRALLTGGRGEEDRRCIECAHMILTDAEGTFCGCAR